MSECACFDNFVANYGAYMQIFMWKFAILLQEKLNLGEVSH